MILSVFGFVHVTLFNLCERIKGVCLGATVPQMTRPVGLLRAAERSEMGSVTSVVGDFLV